jgi:hypothetical protein
MMTKLPTLITALVGSLAMACGSSAVGGDSPSSTGAMDRDSGSAGQATEVTKGNGAPGAGGGGGGGDHDGAVGEMGQGGASVTGTPDSGDGASVGEIIGDATGTVAVKVEDFLNSIGVCSHMGIGLDAPTESATAISYLGVRNVRENVATSRVPDWIALHKSTGVRVCLVSDDDLASTIDAAKQLNAVGALLAVEGPNEPNNWPITYQGQTSTKTTSMPVAQFQKDLYAAVKGDGGLHAIPVFHSSEAGGAEPDNVGLQFLTIPDGAGTLMPAGTKYADFANIHDYLYRHMRQAIDNVAWKAFDPTLNADWSGLYVEFGRTWKGKFTGYSNADLMTLPRVVTETGWTTGAPSELNAEQEGRLYVSIYLSAFKRGFANAFIYMLRDEPESGAWAMLGMFDQNYQPKKAATYLHNLTTILADTGARTPGKLNYSIAAEPETVHDLLLQKSNGSFELVVWDERPSGGSDRIVVDLGAARPTVKVYDPIVGTAPSETLKSVSTVTLTLSDHPVVIEL